MSKSWMEDWSSSGSNLERFFSIDKWYPGKGRCHITTWPDSTDGQVSLYSVYIGGGGPFEPPIFEGWAKSLSEAKRECEDIMGNIDVE